jgi:hypothetical protein
MDYSAGRAAALVGLAMVEQQEKQWEQARDSLQVALAIYQKEGDLPQQARIHARWTELCQGGRDGACERNHRSQAERIYKELHLDPNALQE